jgi:endonuclease/exonuclease/phosphatase family metal-dependent hydrolase
VPSALPLRLGTLNLASGRDAHGRVLAAGDLEKAVATVDADVLAVQEVDGGQPRSHGVDQAAVLGAALGGDWRVAATLGGTPDPFRSWQPVEPPVLRGPGDDAVPGPFYGIAMVSRLPVRRWSVLPLGAGRARLPLQAPDPRTGRLRWWWFPDEPRAAIAAELDGITVIGTHLSFAPHTSLRQLRRLRRWAASLPGPVVVAGDLNLPARMAGPVLGAGGLVRAATFPGHEPRVQLDHLLSVGGHLRSDDGAAVALPVGDHRALLATVHPA